MQMQQQVIQHQEWIKQQNILKSKLITNWTNNEIKYIGGVDISFIKGDNVNACASLIVLDANTLDIVYEKCKMVELQEEYIPGFLAFREVKHLVDLFEELKLCVPWYIPQIIFVDGNGILHYEGFGLASHLGVLIDTPTVGIGKTLLLVDGLDKKSVKLNFDKNCFKKGDYTDLVGNSGITWGAALMSSDNITNPIYVSIGHKISLEKAIEYTLMYSLYRIPEPVRMADIKSREYLRI
jgi:deoxyinosine 3'endonuclease (endonuclease V)